MLNSLKFTCGLNTTLIVVFSDWDFL